MKKTTLFSAMLALLFLAACQKEDDEQISIYAPADNAFAERIFSDMLKSVEEAANDDPDLRMVSNGCVDTILIEYGNDIWTVTVDFGQTNCTGTDGRQRKGKIIATFTGGYRDEGTVLTVTTENFYVDDWKVDGLQTLTNQGENTDGNLYFTMEVEDVELTHPDNEYVLSWESSRTREWTEGEGTWNPFDDVYLIEGTANGIDRLGDTYTINITSPLEVKLDCPWIKSGSLDIDPESLDIFHVDYGNGNCDGNFTVEYNGQTYSFIY